MGTLTLDKRMRSCFSTLSSYLEVVLVRMTPLSDMFASSPGERAMRRARMIAGRLLAAGYEVGCTIPVGD
jgi:hypothetical protein